MNDLTSILAAADTYLQREWVKAVALPSFGVAAAGVGYLLRRMIEKRGPIEEIELLAKVANLKSQLAKDGTNISELRSFQAQALGKEAAAAITTAQRYAETASQLSGNARQVDRDPAFDNAITQGEMNDVSYRKADQADDELSEAIRFLQEHGIGNSEDLQRSQIAWKSYCEAELSREARIWEGGSIRPLMINLKREALTRERIATLAWNELDPDSPELVVEPRKTPRNLLEHIEPQIPKVRVHEILGSPSVVAGNTWIYRFLETQVEVTFEHDIVRDVVVALIHGQVYAGTSADDSVTIPLGRLTLADVMEIGNVEVEYRWSNRTKEVYVHGRSGPPGAWTEYCYGALHVFSGAGRLQDTGFLWNDELNQLISDPKTVLINWMALPGTSEMPAFYWFIK
ncbi:uncharacterized protein YecT (DUF1311 family) [Variovorax sp. SG517]|uniref:lysozyme inhibitor LprI family protein n=1 Tax=Variovorax sp. SG517 TaxID=2587117 RepID=UPI00159DBA4A|nr:lysozyme inhibitor LprI family protein [Variovorax sp. SG517]NVM92891.1 uncharacterized protein YecT (DUF1311 family) [Variovorax sp. SG517]